MAKNRDNRRCTGTLSEADPGRIRSSGVACPDGTAAFLSFGWIVRPSRKMERSESFNTNISIIGIRKPRRTDRPTSSFPYDLFQRTDLYVFRIFSKIK